MEGEVQNSQEQSPGKPGAQRARLTEATSWLSPTSHTQTTVFAFLSHGFKLVSGRDSVGTGFLTVWRRVWGQGHPHINHRAHPKIAP